MTATVQPSVAKSEILIYFLASPKDEGVCAAVHRHLTPIVRSSPIPITVLDDFDIPAGTDREAHHARLLEADIVLSLISAEFIDDDDIYRRNQQVIDRYNRGETLMISILVRNCLWKALPRAHQPQLPKNLQPLSNRQLWPSEDDAAMEVVSDLYEDISAILAQSSAVETDTQPPGQGTPLGVDLTGQSSDPQVLAGAVAGPEAGGGAPTGLSAEVGETQDSAGPAGGSEPDTEVVVQLPVVESAPEEVATVGVPSDVAAPLILPRQTAAAPIQADWRKSYYRRVLWKRALAFVLDYVILAFIPSVVYYMFRPNDSDDVTLVIAAVAFFLIGPAMEASRWRATPGKRILKLEITTESGDRISYFRAFVRNILRSLAGYVYFLTLGLALVPQYFRFRKSKKLFHDEVSTTVIGERLATAPAPASAVSTA